MDPSMLQYFRKIAARDKMRDVSDLGILEKTIEFF